MTPEDQHNTVRRPRSGFVNKKHEAQKNKTLKQKDVRTDIMNELFAVFLTSISQTNSDMRYWYEKLALYNSVGEAMGDRLKELTESLSGSNGKDDEKCKESWRAKLEDQEKNLSTLITTAKSYRATVVHLLKQLD